MLYHDYNRDNPGTSCFSVFCCVLWLICVRRMENSSCSWRPVLVCIGEKVEQWREWTGHWTKYANHHGKQGEDDARALTLRLSEDINAFFALPMWNISFFLLPTVVSIPQSMCCWYHPNLYICGVFCDLCVRTLFSIVTGRVHWCDMTCYNVACAWGFVDCGSQKTKAISLQGTAILPRDGITYLT